MNVLAHSCDLMCTQPGEPGEPGEPGMMHEPLVRNEETGTHNTKYSKAPTAETDVQLGASWSKAHLLHL